MQQGADGVQSRQRATVAHQGGAGVQGFGAKAAQLIIQPGVPLHRQLRAGLQHASHAPRAAAAHHAKVAAMRRCQNLDDRSTFTVRAHGQKGPFVSPFHGGSIARVTGRGKTGLAVALQSGRVAR